MTTTRAERAERFTLTAILVAVGGAAGAASFSHVHEWTMANSPAGTAGWFGWANAVISELVPIAALLTMRQRRRAGKPIGYPMALLVAAATLSLSAQLAVAKPGLTGGLLSAVPALAFMALSKLVLSGKAAPAPALVDIAPAVPAPAPIAPGTVPLAAPDVPLTPGTMPDVPDSVPAPEPTADRIRRLAADAPGASVAALAARAGVSERTVRRHVPPPVRRQSAAMAPVTAGA